jgi:hypothetical protein
LKILAVNSARSIWLVPTVLLNPQGRYLVPIFAEFAARYKFAKAPEAKDVTISPLNISFQDGVFESANGTPIYVSLTVHDDGLVAETRASTDESERFLQDALTWFSSEFELPSYKDLGIKRIYVSELVVEMQLSMSIFSDEFLEFTAKMRRGMSSNPGKPLDLTGLQFGPDPTSTKNLAPFRIERLANTPFKEDRFYCAAPLPTAEHISLLKLFSKAAETGDENTL